MDQITFLKQVLIKLKIALMCSQSIMPYCDREICVAPSDPPRQKCPKMTVSLLQDMKEHNKGQNLKSDFYLPWVHNTWVWKGAMKRGTISVRFAQICWASFLVYRLMPPLGAGKLLLTFPD